MEKFKTNTRQHQQSPCSTGLPDKLTGPQLVTKFPAFYAARRFVNRIHNSPPPVPLLSEIDTCPPSKLPSRRSILILSSHLLLCLVSGFPSGFPAKTLYAHLLYTLYPSHSILFDHPNNIWSTDLKAPCYVVFSTPLLPRPLFAQMSSSAPYSRKPSAYVNKVHTVLAEIIKQECITLATYAFRKQ